MNGSWLEQCAEFLQYYYAPTLLPVLFYVIGGIELLYLVSVLLGTYRDTGFRLILNLLFLVAGYYFVAELLHNDLWIILSRSGVIALNVVVFCYLRKIKFRERH